MWKISSPIWNRLYRRHDIWAVIRAATVRGPFRQNPKSAVTPFVDFFVVFGASIKPNGEPSGAMQRRIEGALALAQNSAEHVFLLTGTPAEFNLMRALLRREGVADDSILEESHSASTLASVIHCSSLLGRYARPHDSVVVCSDRYHIPRCRWLFYLLNVRTAAAPVPSGREANGLLRWGYFYAREMAALILDTLILLISRVAQSLR